MIQKRKTPFFSPFNSPGGQPFNANAQNAASQIDSKSLSYIEDLLSHEALAYKKCRIYSGYLTDSALKDVANNVAMHHKQHFDALQNYMSTHQ